MLYIILNDTRYVSIIITSNHYPPPQQTIFKSICQGVIYSFYCYIVLQNVNSSKLAISEGKRVINEMDISSILQGYGLNANGNVNGIWHGDKSRLWNARIS
jgi:hypothetical protein